MNHGPVTPGISAKHRGNAFFRPWHTLRNVAVFCLVAVGTLKADHNFGPINHKYGITGSTSQVVNYTLNLRGLTPGRIYRFQISGVTAASFSAPSSGAFDKTGALTVPHGFPGSYSGSSPITITPTFAANLLGSLEVEQGFGFNSIATKLQPQNFIAEISLSTSNNRFVGSAGPANFLAQISHGAFSGEYPPDPYAPQPPQRGELQLLLENSTGQEQTIMWGDKAITLAPGMNAIRYDGELDEYGLPAVAPSDFEASFFEADGRKYIQAKLGFHSSGEGVAWLDAPLPPSAPSEEGKARTEILSPETSTKGATIAIRHPNGATTITTLPKSTAPSASNTTGAGAVLSNPTQPKPTQSSTNTTSNTTNNTTNNTTTNNTTIINNDGKSESNSTLADAIPWEAIPDTDHRGRPSTDVAEGLGGARASFLGKVQNFELIEGQSIPRNDIIALNIPLGPYGMFNRTIDLTQTPFPQIRLVLLALMTLAFGIAFLKRLTI